jgi:hypothetical protein
VLCRSACNASRTCGSFAWHTPSFNDPQWANGCYALHGQAWQSTAQPGVISGRGPHTSGVGYRFDAGGHQGGEGNEAGGEWFIEGVYEELDGPNEWFFDVKTHTLYFAPNTTEVNGAPDAEIVVPTLATFISISGSKAAPVRNVSLVGLEFTASRPTFMEARTNPSGGDCMPRWASNARPSRCSL